MADPNGQILSNLYPPPNQDPSKPGAGGFNYANGQTRYSNMLQFRGRVDYNFNQSTKLYVSYNHQHDSALNSLDVLLGLRLGTVGQRRRLPIPHPWSESTTSDVVTANLNEGDQPHSHQRIGFSATRI